jgi:hypothetical protein
MTKVLPQAAIDPALIAKFCFLRTYICRWPTICYLSCPRFISNCGHCSLQITDYQGCRLTNSCGVGGSACDPTQFCIGSDPWVIQDLEDLVTIRAELTATLKHLDVLEKEGLASGINTKAEADQLEAQLKQQLEHVKKVREGLK